VMSERVTFYHNPQSRSRIVHWMLEEASAPYDTKVLSLEKREHKSAEYLAVNPMGKVPAIVHRGVVVTETGAICAYLADAFPAAKLAPATSEAARGTYYRWLFFAAGCFEPAVVDRMLERPPVEHTGVLSYGTYEATLDALEKALVPGPFLVGSQFTAADVYICSQLGHAMLTKAVAPRAAFQAYVARCAERPAHQHVNE
jgi:glutathione S-transferase